MEVVGPFIARRPERHAEPPASLRLHARHRRRRAAVRAPVLSAVARRAFRRPVTDDDLSAPLAFYQAAKAEADRDAEFDAGIQDGLTAILASPKFLFRAEIDSCRSSPAGAIYRISDLDLASRLSFFLWSRLPDDELLDVAEQGRSARAARCSRPRSRGCSPTRAPTSLVTNFAFQWLSVRGIDNIDPDRGALSELRRRPARRVSAARCELFVGSILHDDRSVLDLLTADHTFVNERLALHYGIPNVRGEQFRRVTLTDPNRWGLLGKGSVLLVDLVSPIARRPCCAARGFSKTSSARRPRRRRPTWKVLQGEQPGKAADGARAHGTAPCKPSCNACHGVMDPLGFALENFDAIGEWRDQGSLRRHRHRCVRQAGRRHTRQQPARSARGADEAARDSSCRR